MSDFDLADIYADNVRLQRMLGNLTNHLIDHNHITEEGARILRKFNFDWGCALRPIKGSVVQRHQEQMDLEEWIKRAASDNGPKD